MTLRLLIRAIKKTPGRYLAILLIVFLGVCIFSGIKMSEPAMLKTGREYLLEQNHYDFRLISTLGITAEDVEAVKDLAKDAEGVFRLDKAAGFSEEETFALHLMSMPYRIALPKVTAGVLPTEKDEALGDDRFFTAADIGREITVTDPEEDLSVRTFRLTAIGNSTEFLSPERGTTSVGNGKLAAFLYVLPTVFNGEVFHEMLVRSDYSGDFMTDENDEAMDALKAQLKPLFSDRGKMRYEALISEGTEELREAREKLDDGWKEFRDGEKDLEENRKRVRDGRLELESHRQELIDGRAQLDDGWKQYREALASGIPEILMGEAYNELMAAEAAYEAGLQEFTVNEAELLKGEAALKDGEKQLENARKELTDGEAEYAKGEEDLRKLSPPVTYVLGNDSNMGYMNFRNDITIIGSIGNAFPLFFVLIAALVLITTMTRMVSEERTEIGTLKAMGYRTGRIAQKYMLYAGTAALIGCVTGYLVGEEGFVRIVWGVYGLRYRFGPIAYYFSPLMAGGCFVVTVGGAGAVTYFSCRRMLREMPAELVRPKAPDSGKKILLERNTPVFNRLSFLNRMMLRNAFRYKKRMLMMLVGIAGCTALLVVGFGIKDSVANILNYQYDEILLYDGEITFLETAAEEDRAGVQAFLQEKNAAVIEGYKERLRLSSEEGEREANVLFFRQEDAGGCIDLHRAEQQVAYPGPGEIILGRKTAEKLKVREGDPVMLDIGGTAVTLRFSGTADNYIDHYAYANADSVPDGQRNTLLLLTEDMEKIAPALRAMGGVKNVTVTEEERESMSGMMRMMDLVVVLLTVCAGALAFIVLFNLTNINIMERMREVATVKVLGFRPGETSAYVLRENILLDIIGGVLGLGLGKLFHYYIMMQIHVDYMDFDVRIRGVSYLFSFGITVLFAVIANLFMRPKLAGINMAESLKAVE